MRQPTNTNTPETPKTEAPTYLELKSARDSARLDLINAQYALDEADPTVPKPREGETVEAFAVRLLAEDHAKTDVAKWLVRQGVGIKPLGLMLQIDGGHLNREYKDAIESMFFEYAPGCTVSIADGRPSVSYPEGRTSVARVSKTLEAMDVKFMESETESGRFEIRIEQGGFIKRYRLSEAVKNIGEAAQVATSIAKLRGLSTSKLGEVDDESGDYDRADVRASKLLIRFKDAKTLDVQAKAREAKKAAARLAESASEAPPVDPTTVTETAPITPEVAA